MALGGREKEQEVFSVVKSIVLKINPYSLLDFGLPEDEFDSEIKSIISQLPRCKSALDVAHLLAHVFSSSFGEKFEPKQYLEYGEELFKLLKDNN